MTLIEQLKRDEGCRRVAGGLSDYRDSKGLWTRGYGHLIVPQPLGTYVPKVISEREAHELLVDDLAKHRDELFIAVPWITSHDDVIVEAVINMVFNLGITRLLGFKGFFAALRARDYPMAAIEALDSKWHREDVGVRAVRLAKQLVTKVRQ